MTKIDQFESVFKSAAKDVFHHRSVAFDSVLVVTDLERHEAEAYASRIREFLSALGTPTIVAVEGERCRTVDALLAVAADEKPQLICTYRNLHTEAWQWPHTLGRHVDVLTQAVNTPVMLMPHPRDSPVSEGALSGTRTVMAMTDHLAGDDRLVRVAVKLTRPEGTLWLVHIEDQHTFERYADTISKIASIDTEDAVREIERRLLKEPRDYIRSVAEELVRQGVAVRIESEVRLGRHLHDYRRLVDEHGVDLLVMNTKDDDQLAMHGLAYPLAVELRRTPLLLL